MSLASVGLVTGIVGTTLAIAATIVSGALLTRTKTERLILSWAVGAGASGLLLALATGFAWASLGILATLANVACLSGLAVPVFNVVYRWAEGPRAATDYAVLFGAAFLASFPARIVAPMVAAAIGWPGYFALCTPLFLAATALLSRATRLP